MSSKTVYWYLLVLLFLSSTHTSYGTYGNEFLEIGNAFNLNNVLKIGNGMLEKNGELTRNVSDKCAKGIFHFINALTNKEPWAIQMFDSFGKPESGIFKMGWIWAGTYDECREVRATSPNNSEIAFNGKYCSISLPLPGQDRDYRGYVRVTGFNVGLCVPDSCEKDEIVSLLNSAISPLNITQMRVSYVTSVCDDDEVHYDAKAIIAIVICGIFALLILIGTIYDLKEVQIPKWSKEKENAENTIMPGIRQTVQQHDNESSNSEKTPLFGRKKIGKTGKSLLAFSVYTNASKILSTKQSAGGIHCLEGMRVISLILVITLHLQAFSAITTGNTNFVDFDLQKSFLYQPVALAFAVDTFFMISGLLRAYLTLKDLSKSEGKLNWLMYYFHRFWRLSPPYWMVLFIYMALFPLFGKGPLIPTHGQILGDCNNNWWQNLLYINNFFKPPQLCMPWTWYLAADIQFYILSPILILPLFFFDKMGTMVSMVFLLATSITPAVLTAQNDLEAGFVIQNARIDLKSSKDGFWMMAFYLRPYNRMGPYIVGILTGYFLYKTKLNIKWTKVTATLVWCCSAICLLLPTILSYIDRNGQEVSITFACIYNAVGRHVWSVGISCLTLACIAGYGGPVNTFLSWKGFLPFSRLSYCAYLIHPIIIMCYSVTLLTPIYWTTYKFTILVLGFTVFTNICAFIVSLAFEVPMVGLEMIYFRKNKS